MTHPKSDGKWEDCGCPLSMGFKDSYKLDLKCGPHICLVSRDEWRKHYILDRHAYVRACKAPEDSLLGLWIERRLQEGRLFVAKPPERPPLPPEPWRFDEPPLLSGPLKGGWRYWEPTDEVLSFDNGYTTTQMYDAMLDEFFDLFSVDGLMKKLMLESGEAWILACGTPASTVKVWRRAPIKNDRVFVTADNEFFAMMLQGTTSKQMDTILNNWLKVLDLGVRLKHIRRLLDIRIDSKIRMGGCGHVFSFI
ncbi:hypothetical protein M758_12G145400 [Ceratodon purpureus]|nr:hypothetical protein M758_12G145400 [Ceratodon purpureus]